MIRLVLGCTNENEIQHFHDRGRRFRDDNCRPRSHLWRTFCWLYLIYDTLRWAFCASAWELGHWYSVIRFDVLPNISLFLALFKRRHLGQDAGTLRTCIFDHPISGLNVWPRRLLYSGIVIIHARIARDSDRVEGGLIQQQRGYVSAFVFTNQLLTLTLLLVSHTWVSVRWKGSELTLVHFSVYTYLLTDFNVPFETLGVTR